MRTLRHTTVAVLLGIAAVGLSAVPSQARPTQTAAACSLQPTNGVVTRTLGDRTYLVYVPSGLTGPASLIVSLHGFGQGAALHEATSGWREFANGRQLILAVPEGRPSLGSFVPFWDFAQGSVDVAFLRNLVTDVSANWCVDARHVHAEGLSNGGLMAGRLACDASDVFASVALVGTGPPTISGSPCTPARPVSVIIVGGALDPLHLLGGLANRILWTGLNGCPGVAVTEPVPLGIGERYGPCRAGTEVVLRTYLLQTHSFPLGADGIEARDRIWRLFQDNPLP